MMKKKSKIKKRILQALAVLSLIGLLAWIFIPSPIPVKVDGARLGSFSAMLDAEGVTQARDRIVIWAPVPCTPQHMPLLLGDPVVVKQVVARCVPDAAALLDPQIAGYLNARVAAAIAAKSRALSEREQTAAVVNQARDNLRNAENLVSTSSTSAAMQRDQAQVAMKLIFKEMDSMDAAAQMATFDIEAAQSALNKLKSASSREWEFHTPISGRVLAVAGNGKALGTGETLIEIGNPADMEVIVDTLANASQVAAGQRVELQPVRADALLGRVRRVELIPSDPISADISAPGKTRIAIEFAAPPAKWQSLGNNHALHARIAIATIDNVLKVSPKAIFKDGQQDAVFVIADSRAHKRIVTLSAGDGETAVIGSGLKENEQVILSPSPMIKDGTRVKIIY